MPSKEDWNEVRRSVPPTETDTVPDDSIDYECWIRVDNSDEALTIYNVHDDGFILVRNRAENMRQVGEFEDYESAKEELEEQKEQEW